MSTPEELARQNIDKQLEACGWIVQSRQEMNLYAARDQVNLDIFWLRDESLEDFANLPNPDVLAAEIAEDLRAALEQFESIADDLNRHQGSEGGE